MYVGGSKRPAKLPDPDLSGAANILPTSRAAHGPAPSSGRAKQAQQQGAKPLTASGSDAKPSAQSTGVTLAEDVATGPPSVECQSVGG